LLARTHSKRTNSPPPPPEKTTKTTLKKPTAFAPRRAAAARPARTTRAAAVTPVAAQKASMQFIRGVEESVVPEVELRRARNGSSGTAVFTFSSPDVFQADASNGDITGLFMVDEEGELQTTDVKAKFLNGKPTAIEARYQMRSTFEWDRFIRFMDRYAESAGLGFESAAGKKP
jgi:photosystem II protein